LEKTDEFTFVKLEEVEIKPEIRSDLEDTPCSQNDNSKSEEFETDAEKDPTKSTTSSKVSKRSKLAEENDRKANMAPNYFKMHCDKCGHKFNDWNEVRPHFEEQHNMVGYLICSLCDLKIRRRHFLIDHIDYHLNPYAFKCNVCNRIPKSRSALKTHYLRKHDPKKKRIFECHHCGKTYSLKYCLEKHIKMAHISDEDKLFKCSKCQKR